jgi:ribosomal protein S18 acetylase RimI-like enzyme
MVDHEAGSQESIFQIAGVLAQAFLRDPFYEYIMPDSERRPAQLRWWMARLIRYGYEHGHVRTASHPVSGAAVWLNPDAPTVSVAAMVRLGMAAAPLRIGLTGFVRMVRVTTEWEHLHKQEPARHWYLMVIGVDPAQQGQGIGTGLMRPVLEQADRALLPCYLETMTVPNLGFYKKQGFQVVAEGRAGESAYWTMRRPAR